MRAEDSKITQPRMLSDDFLELLNFLETESYSSIVFLCDSNTHLQCYPLVQVALQKLSIPIFQVVVSAGEEHKTIESAQFIWAEMLKNNLDRNALMINLGGGLICDLGGFSASLYKRGIDFIHLPTTLLAMVDASIGGKCGVDFNHLKNQIGLFQQPKSIFINTQFLRSLPKEEVLSGMAEIYKHALIANSNLWEQCKKETLVNSTELIQLAADLKWQIVKQDPYEKGVRKLLNFGHSIGHGLESFFLESGRPIPHGFAIAAGMICEAYLSVKKTGLSQADFNQIKILLGSQYPKLSWKASETNQLVKYIQNDKKNKNGVCLFVLLKSPGDALYDQLVGLDEIIESLNFYRDEL